MSKNNNFTCKQKSVSEPKPGGTVEGERERERESKGHNQKNTFRLLPNWKYLGANQISLTNKNRDTSFVQRGPYSLD